MLNLIFLSEYTLSTQINSFNHFLWLPKTFSQHHIFRHTILGFVHLQIRQTAPVCLSLPSQSSETPAADRTAEAGLRGHGPSLAGAGAHNHHLLHTGVRGLAEEQGGGR